jgi:hypothetical protein
LEEVSISSHPDAGRQVCKSAELPIEKNGKDALAR